jgi:formylglycine-generating enzyme required for sulfatase activity
MTVIVNAGEFWMGEGQERLRQKIGRSFAVASKEVTVQQFLRFRLDHQYDKQSAPTPDCPVNSVTWYEAAAYCNWLNEQEGIAKDQWCYVPNKDGNYAEGMRMAPNYLQLTGYRLPTEAEWEFACRAGSETAYSFGEPADLLAKYAWYEGNSHSQSQSVGTLRPNEYGLFDMLGNACEWTQDAYEKGGKTEGGRIRDDKEDNTDINNTVDRVLRGGSFNALGLRSSSRISVAPSHPGIYHDPAKKAANNNVGFRDVGFRPARTFTP